MRTDEFCRARPEATQGAEFHIDWLATPGRIFARPQEVLDHPALARAEKRAILASWASDVRAVENEPSLRQIECGAFVPLADILSALRALDEVEAEKPSRWFFRGSGGVGRRQSSVIAIAKHGKAHDAS